MSENKIKVKNKILFDIPHPHFLHFYRNVIMRLGVENVVITCQDTEIIRYLLDKYQLGYTVVGKKGNRFAGKIFNHIGYTFAYVKLILQHNIKCVIATSTSSLVAARLTFTKCVCFDDDDSAVQGMVLKINVKLADYVITPRCLTFENYGKKHHTYRGYQELAYLAPDVFAPSLQIVEKYSLKPYTYALLRMNDFKAYHDINLHHGISAKLKKEIVELLEKHNLSVLISSESSLEIQYSQYQIKIDPIDIHHVIAFARVYIGDSQTMASEAAVLGTPCIRCNTFKGKLAYLKELEEKYALTRAFLPSEETALLSHLNELLSKDAWTAEGQAKRQKMLADMEDVNQYITDFLQKKELI